MLTYKGDDTFKTTPGAIASIFVIAVLAAFSFYRVFIFLNRINPSVSKQGFFRDLNQEPLYRPQDYGFDIAFGIGAPLDPKYGYYTAYEVKYYYETVNSTTVRIKEKTALPFETCGNSSFQYPDQDEVTMYGINNYMCLKNKNMSLEGNYYS